MEKGKKILKILLLIMVIPVFIAQVSHNSNIKSYGEAVNKICPYSDSQEITEALRPAQNMANTTAIFSPILLIVARVLTSKSKKKPFGILISGILIFSMFISNLLSTSMVRKLVYSSKYIMFEYAEIYNVSFKGGSGRVANVLLFIPMVILFAVGVVQLIAYIKEQKEIVNSIHLNTSADGENVLLEMETQNKRDIMLTSLGVACIVVPYIIAYFISSSYYSTAIFWIIRYALHGYIYPIIGGLVLIILYAPKIATKIRISDSAIVGRSSFGEYINIRTEDISSVINKYLSIELALGEEKIALCTPDNKAVAAIISEMLKTRIAEAKSDAADGVKGKNVTNNNSDVDDLKKYKELFDAGIITQEEFDAKKKQILGI